ncbi:MAG TPA: hypothetical protein VF544_11375 [Pyrinomonadaceae bacterium]|jgi:hypothetical protein
MPSECTGKFRSTIAFFIEGGNPVEPVAKPDGVIEIKEDASQVLRGWYTKDGETIELEDVACDCVDEECTLTFTRPISDTPLKEVEYIGTVIDENFIFGHFLHHEEGGPTDGDTGLWGATREGGPFKRRKKEEG